ncbi:MAG: cytochrome P450, partial [Rhizobiales bacterium]|nr:cytochrome P450 [Hyphomicrobiales bacterium]
FTPEQTKARRRLAYIPFSAGPRVCLGDRFAIMEAIIALSIVSRRFRLKLQRSRPVEPSMGVKTWPVGGMPMAPQRR